MSAPSEVPLLSWQNVPFVTGSNVTFYFSTPVSSGDSPISSYTLYSAQDVASPYAIPSSFYQYTVNNLTGGTDYTYSITANNASGLTSPSTLYQLFQPGLPPNQPINVIVSTINVSTALLSWRTASLQDSSILRGYQIEALPNNFNTYPGTTSNVGISVLPTQSSLIITYSNQPSTLAVYARTDGGYTQATYAPFIKNDCILRVDPYMFTQANSTITDTTSTYTFSSVGTGSNITGQNLFMQFSSGQYLQGPSFSSLSSYTIQSWIQLNPQNTNIGNILGNSFTSPSTIFLNIPCVGNSLILQASTFTFAFGGGSYIGSSNPGGGGGYGGGGSGGPPLTADYSYSSGGGGGGSYVIAGGTIYNGISTVQGNKPSVKNPLNLGAGGPVSRYGSTGLIVLSFTGSNGLSNAPDIGISTNGVGIYSNLSIPHSTTTITAYIWAGGGGGGSGNTSSGGGGACVVATFPYISLYPVTSFIGGGGAYAGAGGNVPTPGGGGPGGGGSGAGGGCSFLINGVMIGMAGGGGGAGQGSFGNPGGGGGGQGGASGGSAFNGNPARVGGNPGCNGIGGTAPNTGNGGSSVTYTFPGIIFYSTSSDWMNITVTYRNSTFNYFQNGINIMTSISSVSSIRSGNTFQFGSSFTGNIGQTLIYSRALSTSEIVSNFQATRAIYGV